jgi:hypothetical protein
MPQVAAEAPSLRTPAWCPKFGTEEPESFAFSVSDLASCERDYRMETLWWQLMAVPRQLPSVGALMEQL